MRSDSPANYTFIFIFIDLLDLLKLYQVVYPILVGGANACTFFVRRRHGAVQLSAIRSDSPANYTFIFIFLDPFFYASRPSARLKP